MVPNGQEFALDYIASGILFSFLNSNRISFLDTKNGFDSNHQIWNLDLCPWFLEKQKTVLNINL